MILFADTNWLEAIYFEPELDDALAVDRAEVTERKMRRATGGITISPIVLLEARNVFSRLSREPNSMAWRKLLEDFNGKIFVDPMNWEALRKESMALMEQYAHKLTVGTMDFTVVASARLAGADEILSFDEKLKALASAAGMAVFPPLTEEGRRIRSRLKGN